MNKEINKIHVLDASKNKIYYYAIKCSKGNLGIATSKLLQEKGHKLESCYYMTVNNYDIVDCSNQVLEI
jgi:hypothetical protein